MSSLPTTTTLALVAAAKMTTVCRGKSHSLQNWFFHWGNAKLTTITQFLRGLAQSGGLNPIKKEWHWHFILICFSFFGFIIVSLSPQWVKIDRTPLIYLSVYREKNEMKSPILSSVHTEPSPLRWSLLGVWEYWHLHLILWTFALISFSKTFFVVEIWNLCFYLTVWWGIANWAFK